MGWRSEGGSTSSHPDQHLPRNLHVDLRAPSQFVTAIQVLGVLAVHADLEKPGTVGACLEVWSKETLCRRIELKKDLHYFDATRREVLSRDVEEDVRLDTVGCAEVRGRRYRVDRLSIQVDGLVEPAWLTLRDLGTPASFVVFDVSLASRPKHRCPFHSDASGVALSDIPGIVRVGDRTRMALALVQLEEGIGHMTDLDEARGEALTFLAVVTAAALENGGSRELHRLQLEAARQLDQATSRDQIAQVAVSHIKTAAPSLFQATRDHNSALMDRAIAMVGKNAAKNLRDADVAEHIGMSTSHFRFLFREATGQPFHKYLLAVRLEKARALLCEGASVTDAAKAAGFQGLSHFSRLFTERFSVRPSELRAKTAVD